LAEFFVEMVRLGKQVMIETHSEHLVNAIRVSAAEDLTGHIANNCGIVFIDFNEGTPQIRRLEIQPDGTMPEWPNSFFGDSIDLASRLLKAQSRTKFSK
jgi:predicted ATPase